MGTNHESLENVSLATVHSELTTSEPILFCFQVNRWSTRNDHLSGNVRACLHDAMRCDHRQHPISIHGSQTQPFGRGHEFLVPRVRSIKTARHCLHSVITCRLRAIYLSSLR